MSREDPNFAQQIDEALDGEPVEGVVIGKFGWGHEDRAVAVEGKVISWGEARPLLDYIYDDGFGGADCHAIWLWTPTRVMFVSEYDGSTTLTWVPRNPIDGKPGMPGGG